MNRIEPQSVDFQSAFSENRPARVVIKLGPNFNVDVSGQSCRPQLPSSQELPQSFGTIRDLPFAAPDFETQKRIAASFEELFKEKKETQWTAKLQKRFDLLVRKEALGEISPEELNELEHLQIERDERLLGDVHLAQMEQEQRALADLVSAMERYVSITRPR
jgi:hypothetical protein